jgi:hypothetical protein
MGCQAVRLLPVRELVPVYRALVVTALVTFEADTLTLTLVETLT